MRFALAAILLAAFVVGSLAASPALAQGPCFCGPADEGCCCCTLPQAPCIYASADWLNWKARRSDMDFVIVDPNDDTDPQGNQVNLNYDRNSGARVVLGYHLGPCWDLALEYQGFSSNDRLLVNQPVVEKARVRAE